MDFVPFAVFSTLVLKLVDTFNSLKARDWDTVYKQVTAWISGVAITLLFAQTTFASGIEVLDGTLADLGTWEQVVFGLAAASVASLAHDTVKAIRV